MFGIFKETKIKTLAHVETTYRMRHYANFDLDGLSVREAGEMGDQIYELLQAYEKKNKYTVVELVLAGWSTALTASDSVRIPFLLGRYDRLLRGLGSYLLSEEVSFDCHYTDPRYVPPFFWGYTVKKLAEIEDGLALDGRSVKPILDKLA